MDCCLKISQREGETVVAACDKDLLNKTFSEGELQLSVSSKFYGEDVKSIEELLEALSYASIANLTGNKVVEAAVSSGYIEEGCVLTVSGIKHAQYAVML